MEVARALGPIGTLSHRLWPVIPHAPIRLAVNKVHGALQHLHQIPLWVATLQESRVVESGGKVVEAVCALPKEFSGAWLGMEWMAGRVVSEREKAYICTRSFPTPPNRTVHQHGYISSTRALGRGWTYSSMRTVALRAEVQIACWVHDDVFHLDLSCCHHSCTA